MVTQAQTAVQSRRTPGQLIAISIFWLALNFHWQALNGLIIPSQVIGLDYREAPPGADVASWVARVAPVSLAIVVVPGLLVALLANPLFGLLSDRTQGRFGRRMPYILGGTAVNLVGLAVMAFGPGAVSAGHTGSYFAPTLIILALGLMLTQLANNAAAAPFHALLPDTVPTEQRGAASGIMGFAQLIGTIGGALAPTLFGFNSRRLLDGTQSYEDYHARLLVAYALVGAVVLVLAIVSAVTVREPAYTRPAASPSERGVSLARMWRTLAGTVVVVAAVAVGAGFIVRQFGQFGAHAGTDANTIQLVQLVAVIVAALGTARAFDFSPRRHPDFSWVLATRLMAMMGVYIVYDFLTLYLQFVAHAQEPQVANSRFIIILTLTATLSTLVAGRASDRLGRKRMVYISGGLMALVGAAFVFAPIVVQGNILPVLYGAGAIFGLGYGAYLAVDWALVADVLPSDETYARDMGVWNMVYTIPSALAFVLGAWLIALGSHLGSVTLGYTLLFVAFALFATLGTVTVRYIKGAT
jgi:MFS family permease